MIHASVRLRRALQLRSLSLVKRIVGAHPDQPELVRNVDFQDKALTSLHTAALLGMPDIAEYLLGQGHEESGISRSVEGVTALMIACQAGGETDPDHAGRVAVARLLILKYPDSTAIRDKDGMTAFSHAARHGTNALLEMMLALPPPTDLWPTFAEDDIDLGRRQYEQHPFLDTKDNDGNTPLHHASAAGQLKTLRLLLMAGADASARNVTLWTPVDYSATVAAEVYLRNLAKERQHTREIEQGIAAGAVNITRLRGPSDVTRGAVRLVRADSSDDDPLIRTRIRAGT